MSYTRNHVGIKYHRLTPLKRLDRQAKNGSYYYLCVCDCGNKKVINSGDFSRKRTPIVSCGCAKIEAGKNTKTHGESKHFLHDTWKGIKQRCYDKNCTHYDKYGGRGILVCKEWVNSYETFRDYVKTLPNCPTKRGSNITLDRIKNNEGYRPGNVRWTTKRNQVKNRRITLYIKTETGKLYTISEYADKLGISYQKCYRRHKKNAFTLGSLSN